MVWAHKTVAALGPHKVFISSACKAYLLTALPAVKVMFEGILLKPSMVTPGADSSKREKPEVVADYTLKLLRRRVPPAVPGKQPARLSCLLFSILQMACLRHSPSWAACLQCPVSNEGSPVKVVH